MEHTLLWLLVAGLALLVVLESVWVFRLRLELWANRRAIAVLERAARQPPATGSRGLSCGGAGALVGGLMVAAWLAGAGLWLWSG